MNGLYFLNIFLKKSQNSKKKPNKIKKNKNQTSLE